MTGGLGDVASRRKFGTSLPSVALVCLTASTREVPKVRSVTKLTTLVIAVLSTIVLSTTIAVAPTPASAAACVDSDGDGWGWDGTQSCRMDEAPQCVDSDGDGWGWDGTQSCRVSPETTAVQPVEPESESTWPTCRSANSDPDGDGWGWEDNRSCTVQAPEVAAAVFVPAIPLFLAITVIVGGVLSSRPPVVPDPIRLPDESGPPLLLDKEEERPRELFAERREAYEVGGYEVVVSGATSVTMSKPIDPSDESKGVHYVTLVRRSDAVVENISVQDVDGYATATVSVSYDYGTSVYGTPYRRSTTVVTTRIVNHRSDNPTYYMYVSVNGVQVEVSCNGPECAAVSHGGGGDSGADRLDQHGVPLNSQTDPDNDGVSVFGDMDNDNDGVPAHLDKNDLDPTVGTVDEVGGSSGGNAGGTAGGGGTTTTNTGNGGGDGGGTVTDGNGGTVTTGDGSDLRTGS